MTRSQTKLTAITIASFGTFAILQGTCDASADDAIYEIKFHENRFEPQHLTLPANTPIILKVTNLSDQAIEFESFKLDRERAIGPGATSSFPLPALSAGEYDFFDDFHDQVAEGVITVK